MTDDSVGSFQDFEFVDMPHSSHTARSIKILARSRNTVSMSALAKEPHFHKELAAALGNDWQSSYDLTSTERFKGFVDNLCRSRSSPAICWHQKPVSQQTDCDFTELIQVNSNVSWNRLDDWTKLVFMAIIISVFMALMQTFGIL